MASKLVRKIDGQVLLQLDLLNDKMARRAAITYASSIRGKDPARAKDIEQAATCCGHERGGKWKCCPRAGEYNGFGGPTIFTCPEGCSCHD